MGDLEPRNFLQPCLLLLLAERADHGYELAARLRPLHDGEGDSGGVYRALRSLEKHGLVRSEWRAWAAGPCPLRCATSSTSTTCCTRSSSASAWERPAATARGPPAAWALCTRTS